MEDNAVVSAMQSLNVYYSEWRGKWFLSKNCADSNICTFLFLFSLFPHSSGFIWPVWIIYHGTLKHHAVNQWNQFLNPLESSACLEKSKENLEKLTSSKGDMGQFPMFRPRWQNSNCEDLSTWKRGLAAGPRDGDSCYHCFMFHETCWTCFLLTYSLPREVLKSEFGEYKQGNNKSDKGTSEVPPKPKGLRNLSCA